MVYRGPILVKKLVRFRALPEHGGYTLYFKTDIGRLGRFFRPDKVPEFEGEEAWFEIQNVGGGELAVLRQIEEPAGGRR
jgi:hypothetical protein